MKVARIVFIIWVTTCGAAGAQNPELIDTIPDSISLELENPASKTVVRDLVSGLSDDAVRALLIQRLDAVAEANENASEDQRSAAGIFKEGFSHWRQTAMRVATETEKIPHVLSGIVSEVRKSIAPKTIASLFLGLLIAFAIGVLAERLVAVFFRKRKQQLIDESSTELWSILRILYSRLSLDLLGVGAFFLVTRFVLLNQLEANSPGYDFCYVALSCVAAAWFAYVICRFFFAPRRPDLRICRTSDSRAMRLTISFSLLAGYVVFVHNLFQLMLGVIDQFGGMHQAGPLAFCLNASMYITAIAVIWINRHGLSEILIENKKRVSLQIGVQSNGDASWFANNWPKIAIGLLAMKYACVEMVINLTEVVVYSVLAVYITFIVIFLWPGIDANVSLFVSRGIKTPDDETEAAGKARRRMQQGLLRVGRVLVVGIVLYILASLWGLNFLTLAEAGLGAQVAGKLVELVLIALVAYVVWELVTVFCERWIAREGGQTDEHDSEPGGGDAGGVGLSRIATLLPIIRRTAQFVIVSVAIVMVLNNWGVNIGPLLAGAGVVGLAIGFGAQTLVKDIVSGMFFLADDAFRVGEYIDVGGTMGNVEKISLRSLRLRHHRGLVHTIPYGEIPKLTNFSRDWVIMKLRFRVPFDTDVNKVKKIFKKIGAELLEHEVLGDDFLQPFKSQGVAEVDDNGIVVRGKFMAKPGKQFMIRKELYVRVQKAFEEAGIPFARKQVMVHIPGLDKNPELDEETVQTVAAAAADEVIAQDEAKLLDDGKATLKPA